MAVGSLISQGQLDLCPVLIFGTVGAVVGDQIGYVVGRWGGERLLAKVLAHAGGAARMERARAFADRWGGLAIFLALGSSGPWVNLSSGVASYSWPRFVVWDVLGEALWVALYVMLGKVFSDRIEAIADLATNVCWALVGVLVATLCAWQIVRYVRSAPA